MAPSLTLDLDVIEGNARAVVTQCAARGVTVTGVTKGVAGHPDVARAMLRGGVASLGDSRLENLSRLRSAGLGVPLVLLRASPPSGASDVVELADLSLATEVVSLRALSDAARSRHAVHDVVVMVDLGDLREGVWPDDLPPFLDVAATLPGVRVAGLGTSLGCLGGVVPTPAAMERLAALAAAAEAQLGRRLDLVSGGSSGALGLLAAGALPGRVDHLRIGEAILLGRETVDRRPWPGTRQDGVALRGEVVELQHKPSLPIGPLGQDALGRRPAFADRGWIDRALVNLGAVDTEVGALTPLDGRLVVLGASSDHLVLDATAARGDLHVGDEVAFSVGYAALATAATSPYVNVRTTGVVAVSLT